MNTPADLSADKPASEDDRSQETTSIDDLNSQGTQERNDLMWSETSSSRIGENYQVSFLPSPDTFKSGSVIEHPEPEQIWDPSKAQEERADNFIQNYISPCIKEFAMELLHAKNYNVNGFMRDLEVITPLDGSDWSIDEHDVFRKLMHETKYDVIAASKVMDKSVANCLTVYYKIINVRETRSSRRRLDANKILVRESDLNSRRNSHKKKKKKSKHESGTISSASKKGFGKETSLPKSGVGATPSDPPSEVDKETNQPKNGVATRAIGKPKYDEDTTPSDPPSKVDKESIQPKSGVDVAPSDPPSEVDKETSQPKHGVATRSLGKPKIDENCMSESNKDAKKAAKSKSIPTTKKKEPDDEPSDNAVIGAGSRYNTIRTRAAAMGSTLYSDHKLAKQIEKEINGVGFGRNAETKAAVAPKGDKKQSPVEASRATRRSRRNQLSYQNTNSSPPTNSPSGESARYTSSVAIHARPRRASTRLSGISGTEAKTNDSNNLAESATNTRRSSLRSRISESANQNPPKNLTPMQPKAKRSASTPEEQDRPSKRQKVAKGSTKINNVVKKEPDDFFEERFTMLLEYKKKNGHCYVPKIFKENQTLSYWVFRLRAMNKEMSKGKKTRLTKERVERLKKVGFVFWAKNSKQQLELESIRRKPKDEAKWNSFVSQLQQYKDEFGNCLVPKYYPPNQPLSTWIFGQRQQKRNLNHPNKTSRLTKEKIKQLGDMGFVWQAKQDKEWQQEDRLRKQALVEDAWQNHFKTLSAFKAKTGHTRVPKTYPKNQALSSWVFRQRAMHKKLLGGEYHGLTPSRLQQLEDVSD